MYSNARSSLIAQHFVFVDLIKSNGFNNDVSVNRWFSRGALDIYQCFIVTVTNCVFEDNGFVGVTKFGYQYRGHAGGLSVGKY